MSKHQLKHGNHPAVFITWFTNNRLTERMPPHLNQLSYAHNINKITPYSKPQKMTLILMLINIEQTLQMWSNRNNSQQNCELLKQKHERALPELQFQPSEAAMFSSQKVAAASSGNSEPDVETWVQVPTHSEQTKPDVERILCLPLTTVCWLKIPHFHHQLPSA